MKVDIRLFPAHGESILYPNCKSVNFSVIPMLVFTTVEGDEYSTTLPFIVRHPKKAETPEVEA